MTGSFQEPRHMLADWQRPAPLQSRDLAAATDVERLLQQLTPVHDQNPSQLTLVSQPLVAFGWKLLCCLTDSEVTYSVNAYVCHM